MKMINYGVKDFKSEFGFDTIDDNLIPIVRNEIILSSSEGDERIEYWTRLDRLDFTYDYGYDSGQIKLDLIPFGEGESLIKREFVRKEITIEEIEKILGYKIKIKE